TGLEKRSMRRSTSLPKRMNASTLPPEKAEPRSAPAQKIFSPAPVRMTDLTVSSCSTSDSTASRSRMSCSLMALAGGRFRVTTTKDSSRLTSIVSYGIGQDSSPEDRRDGIRRLPRARAAHDGSAWAEARDDAKV